MDKVHVLFDLESNEYRVFESTAALNKFAANKYGHVEGQVQQFPKHVRVLELPVFSLENVHYAYAH
jgi:hypothetical protein